MSTYEPGTVAVATVRGVPNVRVMRTTGKGGADDCWLTAEHVQGWRFHMASDVTDIRPLVVLDLDGVPFADRLADTLRSIHMLGSSIPEFLSLADQIEAQTKPPRIPEPGWGAVVEAGVRGSRVDNSRRHWLRTTDGKTWHDGRDTYTAWDDLVDPTLVRPGIEDES